MRDLHRPGGAAVEVGRHDLKKYHDGAGASTGFEPQQDPCITGPPSL
jgi:hypothetical protein